MKIKVICPNCHKNYNTIIKEFQPRIDNVCDDCGATLITRSDDNLESFEVRYHEYEEIDENEFGDAVQKHRARKRKSPPPLLTYESPSKSSTQNGSEPSSSLARARASAPCSSMSRMAHSL